MKTILKIFLGSLLLAGSLGLNGCETSGYVAADTGVYYGGPIYHDPWFHEGPWINGNHWYGEPRGGGHVGVYIHPPRTGRHR